MAFFRFAFYRPLWGSNISKSKFLCVLQSSIRFGDLIKGFLGLLCTV